MESSSWYELLTGDWLSRPMRAVLACVLTVPLVLWPRNKFQQGNPRLFALFVYLLHFATIPWLYLVTELVPEPYLVSLPYIDRQVTVTDI